MKSNASQREITLFKDNFNYYLQKWIEEGKETRNQNTFALTIQEMEKNRTKLSTINNSITRYKTGKDFPTKDRMEVLETILHHNLMDESRYPYVEIEYKTYLESFIDEEIDGEELPTFLEKYKRKKEEVPYKIERVKIPNDTEYIETYYPFIDDIKYIKFITYSEMGVFFKETNNIEESRQLLYKYFPFWESIKKQYGNDLIDIGETLCSIGYDAKTVCTLTTNMNKEIYIFIKSKMNTYEAFLKTGKYADLYYKGHTDILTNIRYKAYRRFSPEHIIDLIPPSPQFFEIPDEDKKDQEGVE